MLFNFKSVSIFSLFLLMFASCGSTDVNDDIEDVYEVNSDIKDAFDAIEENKKRAERLTFMHDSIESILDKETGKYSFERDLPLMRDNADSLRKAGVEVVEMNVH